ncbi:MAG: DUF4493 domain-containing protein [Pseudoflavonifractor sp.]|nr:DUF4493 domain-containing protein [Pseudoflavonifractor sp.]
MKKIYNIMMVLAAVVLVSSCSKDNYWDSLTDSEGEGQLSLAGVELSTAETTVGDKDIKSRSGVDVDAFTVKVLDATDNTLVKEWLYGEMPEIITLPVGDYLVKVISHNQELQAWETPYYEGSSEKFSITNGGITEIGTVVCKLANVKVSIRYSDQLMEHLGTDAQVTVLMNDGGQLVYNYGENRSGYFKFIEDSHTLVASFAGSIDGNRVTLRKAYTDIQAGQHRIITFKLKNGNGTVPDATGGIVIGEGLVLDTEVTVVDKDGNVIVDEDVIDGERPIEGDDPTPGPGPDDPTPPTPTNTITITAAEMVFSPATNDVAALSDGKVFIHADKGIAHFNVTIASTSEDFMAAVSDLLPTTFDLAYAPAENLENLRDDLDFPVNEEVIDAVDLTFDITRFFGMLVFPGSHSFTLEIVDNDGTVKKETLILVAQ